MRPSPNFGNPLADRYMVDSGTGASSHHCGLKTAHMLHVAQSEAAMHYPASQPIDLTLIEIHFLYSREIIKALCDG